MRKIITIIIFCHTLGILFPPLFSQEKKRNLQFPIKPLFINRSGPGVKSYPEIQVDKNLTTGSGYSVIFEESFEGITGFPPLGWKAVNKDDGGITGPWFQGNTSIFTAYSGDGYAASNYQGANDFYIDEWMISPRINSVTTSDTLCFWQRSPDYSSWADSIEVRISTTDTAISAFTKTLDYFKTSTTGWTQKKYPLKNFITDGSNIYIAFRYLMYDGGVSGFNSDYVGIDLVQITRPQLVQDMKAVSIDYPIHGTKIIQGSSIYPTVTFENTGISTLSNVPVKLKIISPTGATEESNKTISSINSNQSTQIIFDSYTPPVNGVYTLKAFSLLTEDQNTANDSIEINFSCAILMSGTFTVGNNKDIQTINKAVDSLSKNIISGDITLSLTDPLYNETPIMISHMDYFSSVRTILIKPTGSLSPTINITPSSVAQYGFCISGATKIILDGSNSILNERNTTINVIGVDGKVGIQIKGVRDFTADSNTVKNINIRTSADSTVSSDGYCGILVTGFTSSYLDAGNTISNCDITRHGSIGIAIQWQNAVVLENNFIHDWKQIGGTNDVHGIWVADGTTNGAIRDNIISNIKTSVNYSWAMGIENSSGSSSNLKIYNNFISNILSSGSGVEINYSRGIYSSNTTNTGDGYYFNSVYLSGTDLSTSSLGYSACFELAGGTNITLKNNIAFNETILSGTSANNKAYGIYLSSMPTNIISNNNDLYTPEVQGAVGFNSSNKITLNDWKNSFTPKQDSLSMSADPVFVSKLFGNLHILTSASSPVNAAGIPISGITTDIDGIIRNSFTPDIGADEFIPGEFSTSTNYSTGWNIVSVPLTVPDYSKTTLFPNSISNAFSYDGVYTGQSTLANGVGYWLKFSSPQKVSLGGNPIIIDTIDVKAGWNLIGSISFPVSVSNIIQIPTDNIESAVYGFNQGYSVESSITSGKGYWLKVRQNGRLIFP
jgi:hypothetical protein